MLKVRVQVYFSLFTFYFLLIGLLGCSKKKSPTEIQGTHPSGWSHPEYIKENGFNLSICQRCHGTDYAGGRSEISCNTCHSGTPEACNTCHGSLKNSAPPKDIDDHTATSFRGVGAHQSHVTYSDNRFDCIECHIKPGALYDSGHVDSDLPAEIEFGELAKTQGANPEWNGVTCINAYCHGKFTGGYPDNAPIWTKVDSSQALCGSCHGIPPDTDPNHPQGWTINECYLCHHETVDSLGNIIDKNKHVNGVIDVY